MEPITQREGETLKDFIVRRDAAEREETLAQMCEHMRALIVHCESVGVRFGGCGDCGSPWLTCATCGRQVDGADWAFSKETEVAGGA